MAEAEHATVVVVDREITPDYRVTLVVADLGWVDLKFYIPLSAKFGWGTWESGRTCRVARQDDGT